MNSHTWQKTTLTLHVSSRSQNHSLLLVPLSNQNSKKSKLTTKQSRLLSSNTVEYGIPCCRALQMQLTGGQNQLNVSTEMQSDVELEIPSLVWKLLEAGRLFMLFYRLQPLPQPEKRTGQDLAFGPISCPHFRLHPEQSQHSLPHSSPLPSCRSKFTLKDTCSTGSGQGNSPVIYKSPPKPINCIRLFHSHSSLSLCMRFCKCVHKANFPILLAVAISHFHFPTICFLRPINNYNKPHSAKNI